MHKYVAFLRAINVGGHKSVKMDDLRRLLESLGARNVQTFIQSGNLIFDYEERGLAGLEKELEAVLEKSLGYRVDVFLRTIRQVLAISNQKIYELKDSDTLHIVFLNKTPDKELQRALLAFNSKADDFTMKGREVYNLRRDRDKSVFSNNFIEKVLKTPATTRNWRTICKIAAKYSPTQKRG